MRKLFAITELAVFKTQLLAFGKQFSHCVILDNNQYKNTPQNYEVVAGFGCRDELVASDFSAINRIQPSKKWWLGYLSYDLKNSVEELTSNNFDGIGLDGLHFFEPEIVVTINQQYEAEVWADDPDKVYGDILKSTLVDEAQDNPLQIQPRITKEKYIKSVIQLLNHIQLGDIFEVNFCQEYFAENAQIDPFSVYKKLSAVSPTPFATFLKINNQYCLGASPERFITKKENKVISQPIKGTIKRSEDPIVDAAQIEALKSNKKEQSENIMIVDLVRNDLSRFAENGTVKVEELCGIYPFPQVHQMISTISCTMANDTSHSDIFNNCFPMGSMTGAPKVEAMKLIEQYESTKRGLYSGSVGYFDPEGNFDFNVVIRSILYNQTAQYLSFMVGSAITSKSVPTQEFDETVLKAKAIFEVLA